MKAKIEQNLKAYNIKNTHYMSTFKQMIRTPLIKCLTVLVSLLFSLNVLAVGDLLSCNSSHTWKSYHELHEWMKNNASDIDSKIYMVYSLAKVSLCLGETDEGIAHLQRASDLRHIPATYLLSIYYNYNKTFHSSEQTNSLENLNKAIYYYEKGVQMIEATSNYPEGSTDDMVYIESKSHTSFYLLTNLPFMYFDGYNITIYNIINDTKETFYDDTLEVLTKMGEAATHCLNRPALAVWKEKQETIYQAQQIKCSAYLTFAEEAYHLEQQRLEADQNCTVPLKECTEHQEIVNKIVQLMNHMSDEINLAPKI